jgi:CubicO group peptidase (beta-lactamase class C family)
MKLQMNTALRTACASAVVFALAHASPAFAAPQHTAAATQLGMPTAAPESQGFSSAGLDALNKEMHTLVDQKKLAGVTTLVARHGKVVHLDTYGVANASTGDALKSDSIFRIASMTKPIAGVAMMQLYEQGKWKMDDPVSKYIPEFANLQVKKAGGGTEPMKSPMTMAQVMSHSAGFGVSAVYEKADLSATNLQGMIDKLKALPLETQPGTAWDYGPSVNVQGYLIEKLSGQPLDTYLEQNIFKPLGMVDTGFWVTPEKAKRVVAVHTYDSAGKIIAQPNQRIATAKPSFLSASGGLMSTVEDYWRFAQAVSNGGVLEGKRILKDETAKLMRKNVLKPGVKVDLYGPNMEGIGFGMDFAVVMDPKAAASAQGVDSYYWGGAFGTWFWIDPTNDLVFVGMIQNLNGSRPDQGTPQVRPASVAATYKALTDKSK